MTFWIKIAALGALLGALMGGVLIFGRERYEAGRDTVQVQWNAAKAAATTEQLRDAQRRHKESQDVQDQSARTMRAVVVARDAARADVGRLQDDIADIRNGLLDASDSEPTCRADATARVALELFGECASRREEVAGEAGDLAGRLSVLQRWVSGVCAEPVRPPSEESRLDR